MKMLSKHGLLFCAVLMLSPPRLLADTVCTLDGAGAINTAVTAQCGSTPDAYAVTIYRLAICTADPGVGTTPDFSSCAMLIDGPGQSAQLAAGRSVVLSSLGVMPPNGTYGYAVMIADNSIGISSTRRYSANMTGSGGGSGTGTTCWSLAGTVDRQTPTPNLVDCGTTAAPAITIRKVTHCGNGGGADPSAGGVFNGRCTATVSGGSIYAKLATANLIDAVAADFPNGIARLVAVQTFSAGNQIKIDGSTRGLDIGFDVSNSSSPEITGGGAGGAGGTIRQFAPGPFSMVITTK
jgi:hypothetical protein